MAVNKVTYLLLLAALLCAGACRKSKSAELPPLRLTLASGDVQPLGGKVSRQMAAHIYNQLPFTTNAQPFSTWYATHQNKHHSGNGTAYLLLSPVLNVRENEAEGMYDYVEAGNTLLVVSDSWSKPFEALFGISVKNGDQVLSPHPWGFTDTRKYLGQGILPNKNQEFPIFYEPLNLYLSTDSSEWEQAPISFNHHGLPDGYRFSIGSGSLIVVTNAAAFSNYFLLTGRHYLYGEHIFQQIGTATTTLYWDEFYHRNANRPPPNQGLLHTLLSIPPLRWAFWLLLVLCGIFLLTALVRRQRLIPVVEPNTNATVAFTQTIARLYFSEKDNSNIAQKMIQHFLELIRSRYYMPTHTLDQQFATLLAHKTNLPESEASIIVGRMAYIQTGAVVSDEMLLHLNRDIARMLQVAKF